MSRTSDSGWSARAIAASIERSVHDGRVQPAEALPPVRELAATLKVSPATVAAAYRLLRARGLTAAQGRRGTRVISRPPTQRQVSAGSVPDGAVDLASGNPDRDLLPSLEGAVRALNTTPSLYNAAANLPRLVSFAAGEYEADGVPPGTLALVGGAFDGIERVLREHLRAGDHVAIEDPGAPALHDLITACGYVAVPFALDDGGPLVESVAEALRQNCRAMVVTTRAQNPTGAAMGEPRATELRALLRRHPDLVVVENDPCGPVAGAPAVTLIESSRHRWAHVKSVGKFLGPDLRVAFVAGDALTISRVEGRHALGPRRVSHLLQQLVLSLWSDPSAGRHLARVAEIYRQRREALASALASRGIPSHGVSGLNIWVPVRHENHVAQSLADRGWVVAVGEPFRIRAESGVRITTAALAPNDATRLADAFAAVLTPAHRPSA